MLNLITPAITSGFCRILTHSSVGRLFCDLIAPARRGLSEEEVKNMISICLVTALETGNASECRKAQENIIHILQLPCCESLRQEVSPMLLELDQLIQQMELIDSITEENNLRTDAATHEPAMEGAYQNPAETPVNHSGAFERSSEIWDTQRSDSYPELPPYMR
ncbi:hypothetical protein FRC12_018446 [Ceratobasidium sp. 428]|nr:hypothetical protein FRC12_018446 [Ceratobasidium sp. 428]